MQDANSSAAGTLDGPAEGVWDWLDDIAKVGISRLNLLLAVATIPGSTPRVIHRGRIQAQGDGLKESVAWSQPDPPTVAEGLAMLEALEAKLTKKQLKACTIAFQMAERFIVNTGASGGVTDEIRSFADPKTKAIRVDIEVKSGVAFVPVPTP